MSTLWVVYDHAGEYPFVYLARRWEGETATGDTIESTRLDLVHHALALKGLAKTGPFPGDGPTILETWL